MFNNLRLLPPSLAIYYQHLLLPPKDSCHHQLHSMQVQGGQMTTEFRSTRPPPGSGEPMTMPSPQQDETSSDRAASPLQVMLPPSLFESPEPGSNSQAPTRLQAALAASRWLTAKERQAGPILAPSLLNKPPISSMPLKMPMSGHKNESRTPKPKDIILPRLPEKPPSPLPRSGWRNFLRAFRARFV